MDLPKSRCVRGESRGCGVSKLAAKLAMVGVGRLQAGSYVVLWVQGIGSAIEPSGIPERVLADCRDQAGP